MTRKTYHRKSRQKSYKKGYRSGYKAGYRLAKKRQEAWRKRLAERRLLLMKARIRNPRPLYYGPRLGCYNIGIKRRRRHF